MTIPFDSSREEIHNRLTQMFSNYLLRHPNAQPELSITANFVLEGRNQNDESTYSVW